MADGTRAHGYGRKNDVNVVIGLDKQNNKKLLMCKVKKEWFIKPKFVDK